MKVRAALASALICIHLPLEAKDLGLFYGDPTPAYAMYVVQTNVAAEHCSAAGLIRDTKESAKFLKYFNNGTEAATYAKKDIDFAKDQELFRSNYKDAWNTASPETRERFCAAYNDDVSARTDVSSFAKQVWYFRFTFSPKTPESLARARKWIDILTVGSVVATTTATISSGRDSVGAAKAGDWDTSNQLMAESRNFNAIGAATVSANAALQASVQKAPLISVLEQPAQGNEAQVIRCPVVDHFFNYKAPSESSVWITYMSVHMPCREPTPAEAQRLSD